MKRNGVLLAAVLGAALLVARSAEAQELAAEQVLARAYERYAAIKDLQATINTGVDVGAMKVATPVEFVYRRPDHLYLSTTGFAASTVVQDGVTRWTYVAMLGQYTLEKMKPGEASSEAEGLSFGPAGPILALYLLDGRPLVGSLARPRRLPDADVQGRPCYVVSVLITPPGMETAVDFALNFDKENTTLLAVEAYVPLPAMQGPMAGMKMHISESYRDIKIDQGIPDQRFVFEPPKGARLVKELGRREREKPELVGKRAPDFKVKDLSGKTVTLADFKEKVLLLDFWATWCPPCRREMPDIQRTYEQGKAKGLAVLAISDEDVKDVKEFIRKNRLILPVAVDEGGNAGKAYGVEAIPSTFIIDGKGVVRAGFTGLTSGVSLAEEISRLGVKIEAPGETALAGFAKQAEAAQEHHEAGLKMFLLGRDQEAEKELRAAAEAVPDHTEGWLTLGEFYLKTSRPQEARKAFDRALEGADQAKHATQAAVANAYLDSGIDYDTALEHAREAVRLNPDIAEYWSTLGWICHQKGMREQTVANLKKALKLDPGNAVAHYRLGAAYEKQGEVGLARMQYKDAVKFDPSLEEAKQALERLK